MNYFEFFDLPVHFNPDQKLLKQKFFAHSKTFHPDFYVSASEEKQAEVLEMSSFNNKAFNTLKNEALLIPYVLELLGELKSDEPYKLDQSFLMEMMEINEALMDLKFEPNPSLLADLKKQIETIESGFQSEMKTYTQAFDAGQNTPDLIQKIKNIYFKNKYLLRLKEQLVN